MKHILVPCDFSDRSCAALRYAKLFIEKFGASLTVMYADPVQFPADVFIGGNGVANFPLAGTDDDLERDLREQVFTHVGPNARFATRVVTGAPAPSIVKVAHDIDADFLIIGTRGLHGWRRTLLGSVTLDVIHSFDGSVLVIEPPETPGPAPLAKITRILCPVNMTSVAREAVRIASSMATRFAAQLVIAHVVEDGHTTYDSERALRKWLANEAKPDVAWREIVMRGGAAERVLDCADDLGADLLVVGAQHKFLRDETIIGSTTERLLRFAKCPVLNVIRELSSEGVDEVLAGAVPTVCV